MTVTPNCFKDAAAVAAVVAAIAAAIETNET